MHHKHEDIQKLRDEFSEIKTSVENSEDSALKEKMGHPGRKRSFTDELKMHNIERAINGDGIPTRKDKLFFALNMMPTELSCPGKIGDLKKERLAKKRSEL